VSEPEAGGDHWDHLERLFAEQYRREFESEENVWRSLPFFSATLALQVAVVVQVAPLVPGAQGALAWLVAALVVANAALAGGVLFFLARSIKNADLSYIAGEEKLLEYLGELEAFFAEHGFIDDRDRTPKAALRRLLVEQYAEAAGRNRTINRARARAQGARRQPARGVGRDDARPCWRHARPPAILCEGRAGRSSWPRLFGARRPGRRRRRPASARRRRDRPGTGRPRPSRRRCGS
jgi:hypothetical protein